MRFLPFRYVRGRFFFVVKHRDLVETAVLRPVSPDTVFTIVEYLACSRILEYDIRRGRRQVRHGIDQGRVAVEGGNFGEVGIALRGGILPWTDAVHALRSEERRVGRGRCRAGAGQ